MTTNQIDVTLSEHAFFRDLPREDLKLISGCGSVAEFGEGHFLAREGESADHFYLIRNGTVAIETHVPERGAVMLQTLRGDDILGWSWLFPPYLWTFDARTVEATVVIAMNGKCLREKAERDPAFGYRMMKRFARIMTDRLRATRLQLLDVYGKGSR